MAVTAVSQGTQSASVGTEHFLNSPQVAGRFQLQVDLSAMAAGDVVELRVYKMVLTSGTARVAFFERYEGPQPADNVIAMSDAVANVLTDANSVRFSLKQTFGTTKDFAWAVLNLEDATAAPADSTGVTTLLSRLSATRAGYLDNLSAGAVALEASLQGLITTVASLASAAATAVWSAVTRTLTAGTNIALAKGTGLTGLNDLSSQNVADAVWNESLVSHNTSNSASVWIKSLIPNSIATWGDNMLRYFRLLMRKDAAVATDHAGELAVINQNTGSGAGAYDNTTDSMEARQDDKAGYSLTSAYDPAKTAAQAGDAMTLTAAYDAAKAAASQTSVDGVAAAAAAAVTSDHGSGSYVRNTEPPNAATIAAAVRDVDNATPASGSLGERVAAVPTSAQNADKLLGRNIAGGSDGGRDVTSALRATRNRVVIDGTTITVYAEDDTTPAWTGTVTRVELDALQEINPA